MLTLLQRLLTAMRRRIRIGVGLPTERRIRIGVGLTTEGGIRIGVGEGYCSQRDRLLPLIVLEGITAQHRLL